MVEMVVVAIIAAGLATAVFVIGDRVRPDSWRQSDDDSSGALALDLIATFFTAVVAFVIVICWQQYDNARMHTVAEADSLVEAYWAADGLPTADRTAAQTGLRDYTAQVIGPEWAVMDDERALRPDTQLVFDALRAQVDSVDSPDQAVLDRRDAAADALDDVAHARQDRATDAALGVPGFLWGALIFGTVLLMLSPILSGVRVSRRSVLMTGLLGVVVGASLWQIQSLDHPFSGGNPVPRAAFEIAVARFDQIDLADHRFRD